MEMQQLRHFVAAVQHGNIGRAAEHLNITQPAMSRSIKNLELSMGAELLERGPKGVHPTVFGESVLEHARIIISEAERAVGEIHAIQGLSQGQFTIGISPNFATFIIPEAIGRLTDERPGVNISLNTGFYDDLVAGLRRAEVDLVFSILPPTYNDPDLCFEELYVNRSGVHARADHPLAAKESVSLSELSAQGWVVPNQQAVNRVFRTFFTDNGLPVPRQVIRTSSIAYLKQALLHTSLLAILPENLVRDEIASGEVVKINNTECAVESQCGFITRRNSSTPPAVLACMERIREVCKDTITANDGVGDPKSFRQYQAGKS